MMQAVLLYLIIINLIAFALYGAVKSKAKRGKWRISEKTLIGIALIGGSIGAFLGMHAFRHKTRHWYFRYGLPAILVFCLALLISSQPVFSFFSTCRSADCRMSWMRSWDIGQCGTGRLTYWAFLRCSSTRWSGWRGSPRV